MGFELMSAAKRPILLSVGALASFLAISVSILVALACPSKPLFDKNIILGTLKLVPGLGRAGVVAGGL